MTSALDKALGLPAQALTLRGHRAKILAANIANADTPGFLARDIDFSTAFREAQGADRLRSTHVQHLGSSGAVDASPMFRIPTQPAADGNTVDTHTEKARFVENAVSYQADLQFLNNKIRGLLRAIRGE